MPMPLAWLRAFLGRLRSPTLFGLSVALFLLSWLWPFDPIPFVDEVLTLALTLLLANWKRGRKTPDTADDPRAG